ncbi:MAG: zinc ribbon domain-containing protein [Candidatus Gracilibacteria bacterium]|jgi:putative FmdB family regulatory protein
MPIYSYKCADCKEKFEVDATIKEKEERANKFNCPKCKSKNIKQSFSLKTFFSKGKSDECGCCCGGKCKK